MTETAPDEIPYMMENTPEEFERVRKLGPQPSSESPQLSYRYRDGNLAVLWQTSVPKDDEAALGYFHTLMGFGKGYKPVYCERITRDPNGDNEQVKMLDEIFDPEARETKPFRL